MSALRRRVYVGLLLTCVTLGMWVDGDLNRHDVTSKHQTLPCVVTR